MHDRYYEPEDIEDFEELDTYVTQWVNDETGEEGLFYPFADHNWAQACSELGYDEPLQDDQTLATHEQKEAIIGYWTSIAIDKATEAYYDNL